MAFLETFDDSGYNSGDNLSGKNGGSGWGGAWSNADGSASAWTIDNAQSISSPNSAKASSSNFADDTHRAFGSSMSAGTFYISWRYNSSVDSYRFVTLGPTSTANVIIFNRGPANIFQYFNGAGYTTIYTPSADTWYRIGIQWDNAGHPNQARFNVSSNGGTEGDLVAWTSWTNVNGNFSSVDYVRFNNSATQAGNDWFDNIKDSYAMSTNFTRSLSDSVSYGASRTATIGRIYGALRALSDTIAVAASRLATVVRQWNTSRALSDSIMNAVSRLSVVGKGVARALSDSIMNAASRFTSVSRLYGALRAMSDSISVAASRLATLTFVKTIIRALSDSIMNAKSRLVTLAFGKGFVRTLSDSIMNAASRFSIVSSFYPIHTAWKLFVAAVTNWRGKSTGQ